MFIYHFEDREIVWITIEEESWIKRRLLLDSKDLKTE